MIYSLDNGYIYREESDAIHLVGSESYAETVRIDDKVVVDVTFQFDLEQGKYVETSRIERDEPIPPQELSPQERIKQLENESAMLAVELIESQIRLEQAESNQGYMFLKLVDKGVI